VSASPDLFIQTTQPQEKTARLGILGRDLKRAAQLLLGIALRHTYRVLVLLFGDSIFLKLGVAVGSTHLDDFTEKGCRDHVSELGSLTSVDLKAHIITPQASRIVEKAGHSWLLALRTAELPCVLALVVSFRAVGDAVHRDRRI
jgi:cyanate permease